MQSSEKVGCRFLVMKRCCFPDESACGKSFATRITRENLFFRFRMLSDFIACSSSKIKSVFFRYEINGQDFAWIMTGEEYMASLAHRMKKSLEPAVEVQRTVISSLQEPLERLWELSALQAQELAARVYIWRESA